MGWGAVEAFTEVELLPSSGVRMYRAVLNFALGLKKRFIVFRVEKCDIKFGRR